MREANRVRKGDIQYKVQLNEEQKMAKQLIYDNQIVVITGRAGSGKTLVACQTALDFLNKKMVDKILITRALVEVDDNSMGFLPGTKEDKLSPYLEPMMDNFEKCMDIAKINDFVRDGYIKAGPLGFLRGKTIDDVVILDEAQNTTEKEMEALVTRVGITGKIIILGDSAQRDKTMPQTGLDLAIKLSKNVPGIPHIKLQSNHRSGLVEAILNFIYGK